MMTRKSHHSVSRIAATTSAVLAESLSKTAIEKIRIALSELNVFADLGIAHGEKCGKHLGPKSLSLLSKKTGIAVASIKELAPEVFCEIEKARRSVLLKLLEDFPGINNYEIGRRLNVEPDVVGYYLKKYGFFAPKCTKNPNSCLEVSDSVRTAIEDAILSIGKTKLKFAGRKPSFWTLNAISKATGICAEDLKRYSDSGAMDFFEIASKT
jgi:hypothetical protein